MSKDNDSITRATRGYVGDPSHSITKARFVEYLYITKIYLCGCPYCVAVRPTDTATLDACDDTMTMRWPFQCARCNALIETMNAARREKWKIILEQDGRRRPPKKG